MQITTDEKVLSDYAVEMGKCGFTLKEYPKSQLNAAFALRQGKGNWWGSSMEPCHNRVGYSTSATDVLINAFTRQFLPHQTVLIDYLLDLYKGVMDDNTILVKDKETGNYKYILFEKFNEKDIKLATSFLIATRMHQQFFATPLFIYLLKQGFSPDSAFILLHTFKYHPYYDVKQTTVFQTTVFNDLPRWGDQTLHVVFPSTTRLSFTDPTLLYNRSPRLFGSLKTGQTPQPCNLIWSSEKGVSCIKTIGVKHNQEIVSGVKGYARSVHAQTIVDCYIDKKPMSKDIVNYIENTWRKGDAIE